MKKRLLGGVLMLMMVLAAGCAGGGGEIKMVTNAEFPPFEYVTDSGLVGRFDGIDVAIGNEIAKEAKKTLVIEDVPFESILIELNGGMADFAAAGMTASDERRESVDFSTPYFNATQFIIAAENNVGIASAADLTEKRVGVVDGYTGQEVCMNVLRLKNLENYKKPADAVLALSQGRLDAVVLDSHTATALVNRTNGLKLVEDPEAFENEMYAVAVKKGDKKTLELVNRVIERMLKDGTIDGFVATYGENE